MMSGHRYNGAMARRSTFLVHVTPDGSVWVKAVATGDVVSVPGLDRVGAAIERWLSEGEPGEDAGVQG